MQIFYPYSMQLYPKVFPGEDPSDCPRNVNQDQSVSILKRCFKLLGGVNQAIIGNQLLIGVRKTRPK